jgi:hypothetical protein
MVCMRAYCTLSAFLSRSAGLPLSGCGDWAVSLPHRRKLTRVAEQRKKNRYSRIKVLLADADAKVACRVEFQPTQTSSS